MDEKGINVTEEVVSTSLSYNWISMLYSAYDKRYTYNMYHIMMEEN